MSDELTERLNLLLSDRFTIERELGGGGMSRVFVALARAWQASSDQDPT